MYFIRPYPLRISQKGKWIAMTHDTTSAPRVPPPLAERIAAEEQAVNRIRKAGRPAEIIAAAERAAEAIGNLIANPAAEASGEKREGLLAIRRLLFNAAADCWPGWSMDSAPCSEAELESALALARRSADLAGQLNLAPRQQGTAQWLIGAFELALRSLDAAAASFSRAEVLYERAAAPSQRLLARGYGAIVREAGGRSPQAGPGSLQETLAAIAAGDFPDGAAFIAQLSTAHQIFV
jgi:hypothetical protein